MSKYDPLWKHLQIDGSPTLRLTFEDIEELAAACKFKDCSYTVEPDCMVQAAITDGRLFVQRFESYRKLQREADYANLNFRQTEAEKINRMFGGKKEGQQFRKSVKER
jgi:ribosome biogenesis GTPase